MKLIKTLLFFICFVAIAAFILSYIAPAEQKVIKTIRIQAPAAKVYQQLLLLQQFTQWNVWTHADAGITHQTIGKDGTIGAKTIWEGDPLLSGKGSITLTGLQLNRQVKHQIVFLEPQKINATSIFDIQEQQGFTTVTWTFTVPVQKPFNIYNFFYSLDKERGKDFEEGLQLLKASLENTSHADAVAITPYHFPLTKYIAIKEKIAWIDFITFFDTYFKHLSTYAYKDTTYTSIRTALYYNKDEKAMQSQVAAAISIPLSYKQPLPKPEEYITLPASNAVAASFTGGDDKKIAAYAAIDKYATQQGLKIKKPIIEEHIVTDTAPLTRIIYLLQ